MKQAIAGVAPSELGEVTVTTTWPSVSLYGPGRFLGQLYDIQVGFYVFTVGNICALLFIPVSLALYFLRLAPWIGVRYRLTNQRVVVLRGLQGKIEDRSIRLDRFDSLEVEVQPGQHWYDAGDLVFRRGGVEQFRLGAVSRPRVFRSICLKAHLSFVGVQQAQQARQAVVAG